MAATRFDIWNWFTEAKEAGATHMIIVCDTFDYEDYPVFVLPDEDVHETEKKYRESSMQKVMEVYKIDMDAMAQLNEHRAFNY